MFETGFVWSKEKNLANKRNTKPNPAVESVIVYYLILGILVTWLNDNLDGTEQSQSYFLNQKKKLIEQSKPITSRAYAIAFYLVPSKCSINERFKKVIIQTLGLQKCVSNVRAQVVNWPCWLDHRFVVFVQ